jgi:hypothetical protein
VKTQRSTSKATSSTDASKEAPAENTAAPESDAVTQADLEALQNPRYDLPANDARRMASAQLLQSTMGNAFVQRLMEPRSGSVPEAGKELESQRGGGEPLPDAVRSKMELAFGQNFGSVRVHTDAAATAMTDRLDTKAVTQGDHVYFQAGTLDPGSDEGEHLLAHELAHVVQQKNATATAPMTQRGSAPETAANDAADRVASGQPAGRLAPAGVGPARADPDEAPSLGGLRAQVSKAAHTPSEIVGLEKITVDQLETLHVDDLEALKRSTEAMMASASGPALAAGESPPIWVDYATNFIKDKLDPVITAKRRDGEVAKLFWPLVEHVKESLPNPRLLSAFLNVLPYTERYLSSKTAGPAKIAFGIKEQLQLGAPMPSFEALITQSVKQEHVPTLEEMAENFSNVPKAIASLFYEVVSEEVTAEGIAMTKAFDGEALRAVSELRIERLGAKLITQLGQADDDWFTVFKQFAERYAGDSVPTVLRQIKGIFDEMAADPTTVTSCYLSLDQFAAPGFEMQTPDERFQRAMVEMSREHAGATDPTPLSWSNPEAQLLPGVWTEVEVVARKDDRYIVHPVGLTTEHDQEVSGEDLRPKALWSQGEEVMVEWEGVLYPGRILESDGEWARLHWYGYGDANDQNWIATSRLQAQGGKGN